MLRAHCAVPLRIRFERQATLSIPPQVGGRCLATADSKAVHRNCSVIRACPVIFSCWFAVCSLHNACCCGNCSVWPVVAFAGPMTGATRAKNAQDLLLPMEPATPTTRNQYKYSQQRDKEKTRLPIDSKLLPIYQFSSHSVSANCVCAQVSSSIFAFSNTCFASPYPLPSEERVPERPEPRPELPPGFRRVVRMG